MCTQILFEKSLLSAIFWVNFFYCTWFKFLFWTLIYSPDWLNKIHSFYRIRFAFGKRILFCLLKQMQVRTKHAWRKFGQMFANFNLSNIRNAYKHVTQSFASSNTLVNLSLSLVPYAIKTFSNLIPKGFYWCNLLVCCPITCELPT